MLSTFNKLFYFIKKTISWTEIKKCIHNRKLFATEEIVPLTQSTELAVNLKSIPTIWSAVEAGNGSIISYTTNIWTTAVSAITDWVLWAIAA